MTLSINDVSSFMDAVFYSVVIIWYLINLLFFSITEVYISYIVIIYLTDTNIK